jgi:Flp pilus assembly pilin Flp
MQRIIAWAHSHLAAQEGQTMAEYAVILTLITAAVIVVLGLLGANILNVFTQVKDAIVPR